MLKRPEELLKSRAMNPRWDVAASTGAVESNPGHSDSQRAHSDGAQDASRSAVSREQEAHLFCDTGAAESTTEVTRDVIERCLVAPESCNVRTT